MNTTIDPGRHRNQLRARAQHQTGLPRVLPWLARTRSHTHARNRVWARSLSRTASSTTLTPPTLADWTDSGARTSGLTAPPRGATRTAIGGAATTSTPRPQPQREYAGGPGMVSMVWLFLHCM